MPPPPFEDCKFPRSLAAKITRVVDIGRERERERASEWPLSAVCTLFV